MTNLKRYIGICLAISVLAACWHRMENANQIQDAVANHDSISFEPNSITDSLLSENESVSEYLDYHSSLEVAQVSEPVAVRDSNGLVPIIRDTHVKAHLKGYYIKKQQKITKINGMTQQHVFWDKATEEEIIICKLDSMLFGTHDSLHDK